MKNDGKYPNCEIEPKLAKIKKSKLGDGMENDAKYPNCEMEPKLAKVKKSELRDGTKIG